VTCSVNRVVYPVKLACHPVRISWGKQILTGLVLVRMTNCLDRIKTIFIVCGAGGM
jgi:hypothetical protein